MVTPTPIFYDSDRASRSNEIIVARVPMNKRLWFSFKALTHLRGFNSEEILNRFIRTWIDESDGVVRRCNNCGCIINNDILYIKKFDDIYKYYCSTECISIDER